MEPTITALLLGIIALALLGLAMTRLNSWLDRKLDLIAAQQRDTNALLGRLVRLLTPTNTPTPTAMTITQLQGESNMAITGIVLGATGTLQAVATAPAGAAFPAGTTFTWSSSDTLTTLTPSADTTQVAVATVAGDTATSFTLTCTSNFTPQGATAPLSATATVPLTAPAAPQPTAMGINQLS
jgi:hypothetical protein